MGVPMRKTLKILHTLAACGLIGGVLAHMVLLAAAPQDTPQTYADVRQTIAALGNYVLLPSLGVVLVSGLLSMAVHKPYQEKWWAWIKAATGIGTFESVLSTVGKADFAAAVSVRIAEGSATPDAMGNALDREWGYLIAILVLSVANVVLGVWRPRFRYRPQVRTTDRSAGAIGAHKQEKPS